MSKSSKVEPECNFCGKSEPETLIQAPVGYICKECVKICATIIERNVPAPKEEEVRGWQPIETAPKDGTEVLLVWHWNSGIHKGVTVITARWYCRTHVHKSSAHDCPNVPECKMGWDAYAGWMSHWMPLPTPPAPLVSDCEGDDEGR